MSDSATPDAVDWRVVFRCIAVVVSVQFFVAMEGSMLLPLGPMLATTLHFPAAHLGYMGSAFLVSAAVAGLVGSLFLDRFDRRRALTVALGGLSLATGLTAVVNGLEGLMVCRFIAGMCGGPAAVLGLTIIGDSVPASARGRAMGAVSTGSGLALVLGVPLALVLAGWLGWRGMFLLVAVLGLALTVSAAIFLPSGLGGKRGGSNAKTALREFGIMLRQRSTLLVLAMTMLLFSSIMVLATNLASYLVYNLGVPQSELKYIWSLGGLSGICASQGCSYLIDRYGAAVVFGVASALTIVVFYLFFVQSPVILPPMLLFCCFLACVSARIVTSNTITSLTSQASNRGRFMSLAGTANQAASGIALLVVSHVLFIEPSGAMGHMVYVGYYGIFAAAASAILAGALLHRKPTPLPT